MLNSNANSQQGEIIFGGTVYIFNNLYVILQAVGCQVINGINLITYMYGMP